MRDKKELVDLDANNGIVMHENRLLNSRGEIKIEE